MRTLNSLKAITAALVASLVLVACAAQGFNERLAGGYSTVSFARDAAGTLLDAGKVTPAEAENVQRSADDLRGGLDIARELSAHDLDTAEAKLSATLVAIAELKAFLLKRGAVAPGGEP